MSGCDDEQCSECGNSTASIGAQLAQAYHEGLMNGRANSVPRPRRRVMTSWRSIALALGDRMAHHQYCAEHPVDKSTPDCPFCHDRAVYRRFRRFAEKCGIVFSDPIPDGPSMTLPEIRRQVPGQ